MARSALWEVVRRRVQKLPGELKPHVVGQRIRLHRFRSLFKNPHPVSAKTGAGADWRRAEVLVRVQPASQR
jgi:hypothetical protein